MPASAQRSLPPRVRGWLRHLWRKATTEDDWSSHGEPHPWWDRYSLAPMLSFPRFDLSESSYGLLLMARRTPAWREVYTRILDELIRRHTSHWAAVDWLTQIGADPQRDRYPEAYRRLIPKDLWGNYDVPGWTANGLEPWGLQPDPVGADGNLFFRGFFTLLLAIHRAVSGEHTWERPFEVAGLEDRNFEWTHARIASFLADQWREVPHGPHCENTKVWPYCLSAAGLGLQMTDLVTGSRTHDVYDTWVEDFLERRYLGFDAQQRLQWVGMYYDPQLDRVHGRHRLGGLPLAFYVLPQNRELAETLYRAAVASVGWDRRWLPVLNPGGEPRMLSLAVLLAREFGDQTTERRAQRKLQRFENGRWFDGARLADERLAEHISGTEFAGRDEFGYFFSYGESWPRGQESALLMLRELLEGEGAWARAFNQWDESVFTAPTVCGVDYPQLGIGAAFNDEQRGTLEIETYAASRAARGARTRFQVCNLPDAGAATVLCDGVAHGDFAVVDGSSIELGAAVGEHSYRVVTGWGRDMGALAGADAARAGQTAAPPTPGGARGRLRATELLSPRTAGSSLGGGCPCCIG